MWSHQICMEDLNFSVYVGLTKCKRIQVYEGKNLIFLNLALHIWAFSHLCISNAASNCSYVHANLPRVLSHYVRKIHYTRYCLIFLQLFGRWHNTGFIGRITLACVNYMVLSHFHCLHYLMSSWNSLQSTPSLTFSLFLQGEEAAASRYSKYQVL